MNIRLILLVVLIVAFAGGCGAVSYLSGGGITLEQAYDHNHAQIVQNTTAGTIPHLVIIKNNGTNPVVVDKGTILKSKDSQDLVVIEDKKISPNTNDTVKAYCMEPETKAIPGSALIPSGTVSTQIMQIISSSNSSDLQNATKSQLQIWIIVSKGQVDPYSGEAMAVVQSQKIKYYQLKEKLDAAKSEVMARFNVGEGGLQNLTSTSDSSSFVTTSISDFRQWIRSSTGI